MARPTKTSGPAIPNYRRIVRAALPEHYFKPDYWNLLWFIPHLTIIGLGLYLLANHFSFWAAPLLCIVIGHSLASLGFLGHDIAHGGSIKNKTLRDFLAAVGFSGFSIGPYLWRKWHNADHHNNTQVEGVDPDHLFTIDDYKHNPVLKFLYRLSPLARNLVIFSSFTFRMTQHNFNMLVQYLRNPNTTRHERLVMISQFLTPTLVWVIGTWAMGSQVLIWGYLLPLLVANLVAISYIATNHFLNPLADESDVLATSLSVTLPHWLRWLDPVHSYFGAHVAHHLFPQAPARYVRRIDVKVAELFPGRFHQMPLFTALKALWNTPWVYDEDRKTLIDPHREVRAGTLGHGLTVDGQSEARRGRSKSAA